jgi:hypothetical protein
LFGVYGAVEVTVTVVPTGPEDVDIIIWPDAASTGIGKTFIRITEMIENVKIK